MHLLLDSLSVLKDLAHRIRSSRPVLLEDGRDLVDRGRQILDICPLSEGLSSSDEVLHVVVLCEVCVLQVFVVPEKERRKVKRQVRLTLNLG